MYRFFTLNYKNYKKLNEGTGNYRGEISAPLELLSDIKAFNQHKINGDSLYKQASNLVYSIQKEADNYPRFNILKDDLYYLDFDAVEDKSIPVDLVEEQIKLVDLMLSFAYTY